MSDSHDTSAGPGAQPPRGGALSDEQLGHRAVDGDREAFAELFSRYESGLYNVTLRLTGSREDAADITQEAFVRVFARLDELHARDVALGPYLHRTARNLVYDHGARRAREVPSDAIERDAGPDPGIDADPERHALLASQGEDVRAANARLPERQRLALALRELEGMSYADIGRVLDISEGAVAQLLARARFALRRELRLQQVDVERMDPACRARLGYIGGLIDGELPAEGARDLLQHVSECPTCRASRAAFEDARTRYRAWLPLPVAGLGLGAEAARAAYAADGPGATAAGSGDPAAPDDVAASPADDGQEPVPVVPPVRGGRVVLAAGAATLLLLLVGGATLVGMRSGATETTPAAEPNVAAGAVATLTLPARARARTEGTTTGTTTAGTTTTDESGAPVAAPPSGGRGAAPAAPVTTVVSGVVRVTPAPTTRRAPTTAPGAVAGAPSSPGGGGSAPAATSGPDPEPPRTTRPTTTEAPPTTEEPPTTEAPPTTAEPPTTDTAPDPPGTTPGF